MWFATGRRPAALVAAEQAVEAFMKTHSIRSGQLTVARRGTVRLERAYTWSEPGTRRTGVRDRMLLASNSKVFVCAAVQWLYDRRTGRLLQPMLRPTRRVYPLLGFSGPMDARSDTITIQQLVDHRAGYTNNPTDPTYDMRNIARDLSLSRAPTATEVARRIYASRNLTNNPGAVYSYSNISYLVASLVVERVSSSAYFPFVRQRLLAPLGIPRRRRWARVPSRPRRRRSPASSTSTPSGAWAAGPSPGATAARPAHSRRQCRAPTASTGW